MSQEIVEVECDCRAGQSEIRGAFPNFIGHNAVMLGRQWGFGAEVTGKAVVIGAQAVVEDSPRSHLERTVEVTFDSARLGEELNAWAVDGPWLLNMVMDTEELLYLGMGGDASRKVAAERLRVLLKDTNIMAETLENDAMHQSTKRTADLISELELLIRVLRDWEHKQ
jgi:hypothetical protein